jgi:hypothetical protein
LEVDPGFRKRVPFSSSVGERKIMNHFVGLTRPPRMKLPASCFYQILERRRTPLKS